MKYVMVIFILVAGCAPAVVETKPEQVKVDKTKEYEMMIRQDFEEFLIKAREVMR